MEKKETVQLLYKELSYALQGAAFEVRKDFGLGHKEQIYQKAFEEELKRRNIPFEREKAVKVYAPKDGKYIGIYRPDFIVDDKIIVELKAQAYLSKTENRKIYDYLRNSKYELGYLINFSSERSYIKRAIHSTVKNALMPVDKGLACIGFLLACICGLLPVAGSASTLFTVSANQTVEEGQTFAVDWYLDTGSQTINTVDLKLNFSEDTLEVVEATPGNSLLNLWIKTPAFDNTRGTLQLTGGITHGISGTNIPLFRSVFQAKTAGRGEITMGPDSVNLKNDGMGSPEALTFTALSFPILTKGALPLTIRSQTHPDQNAWYGSRDVKLQFDPKPGEIYSYSFSANPEIYPDNQAVSVPETIEYGNLPDGIYYFKVNSRIADNSWREAGIYRVQIDAEGPEEFRPVAGSDPSASDKQFLSFSTLDKTSGISHYEARRGMLGRNWEKVESPLELNRYFIGDTVAIRAYDQAGNFTEASVDYKGYVNRGNIWRISLGLLVLLLVLGLLWFRGWAKSKIIKQNAN